jgi:hypothetical protein
MNMQLNKNTPTEARSPDSGEKKVISKIHAREEPKAIIALSGASHHRVHWGSGECTRQREMEENRTG